MLIASLPGGMFAPNGLALLHSEKAVPALEKALETAGMGVIRIRVADALEQITMSGRYVPVLIECLRSCPSEFDRLEAAMALKNYNRPDVENALLDAVADIDYLVRYHASNSLLWLHGLLEDISSYEAIFDKIKTDGPPSNYTWAQELLRALFSGNYTIMVKEEMRKRDEEIAARFTKIVESLSENQIDAIIEPIMVEAIKNGAKEFNDELDMKLNSALVTKLIILWNERKLNDELDNPWGEEIDKESLFWKTYREYWNAVWVLRKLMMAKKYELLSVEALNKLGNILADKKDYDKALDAFRRAIALDSSNAHSRNQFAWFSYEKDRNNGTAMNEALEVILPAVVNSHDSGLLDTHACILSALGRYEEAKQQFLLSIQIDEKEENKPSLTWREFQITLKALRDEANLCKYARYFITGNLA
nr:tetratricopeptide repeat protein [Candidatus Sigynarchaeota archaeon]